MKKPLFIALALVLLFSLCACSQAETPNDTTGPAADAVKGKLTWEAINAFPIKYPDMPIQERRQLCVDFFNFSKTALWTPKENFSYYVSGSETNPYTLKAGAVYGGFPYMTVSSGNVYRLLDFMDESGRVDVAKFMVEELDDNGVYSNRAMRNFGNQCSYAAYWGWARVVNSAQYGLTYFGVPQRDFILLGEYPDCGLEALEMWVPTTRDDENKIDNTVEVCEELGEEQMYKNYAALHLGDGLVYVTSGGHFIMCTSEPTVHYRSDGTVDGQNSFVLITEQTGAWTTAIHDEGGPFFHTASVNKKVSFQWLYSGNYVPFTFQEFQEGDILEDTEVSFSHTGETITKEELFASQVTSNYAIADLYVIVTDDDGKEVYRHMVRAPGPNWKELPVTEQYVYEGTEDQQAVVNTLGELNAGNYNVEIVVQLGTGERPTVYTGTLKA